MMLLSPAEDGGLRPVQTASHTAAMNLVFILPSSSTPAAYTRRVQYGLASIDVVMVVLR